VTDDEQILAESGFQWRESNGIKVLVCSALEKNGFVNGFSTRLGGVSAFPTGDLNLAGYNEDLSENIEENRRRFLAVFDGEFKLATVWQVHGDEIKAIAGESHIAESDSQADAVISNLSNILAGVKTADCVPVLIGDPVTGAFAAIHAGWRGTVQSIVRKAIEKFEQNYGSDPANMIAAIGPAAGCKNYEIGADVIDAFAASFSESNRYFSPTREGHALIDLHQANRDQLVSSGVLNANLYTAPLCTMGRPDLFFSYRLEKKKHGKTGRLLSVIGREG